MTHNEKGDEGQFTEQKFKNCTQGKNCLITIVVMQV
jgi:hypothetical protein